MLRNICNWDGLYESLYTSMMSFTKRKRLKFNFMSELYNHWVSIYAWKGVKMVDTRAVLPMLRKNV